MPLGSSYALCALALGQAVVAAPRLVARAMENLNTWLASKTTVALNGILDNMGASGEYAQSADSGIVIAVQNLNTIRLKVAKLERFL